MKSKILEYLKMSIGLFFLITGMLFLWGLMADNFKLSWYTIINLVFLLVSIFLSLLYVWYSKNNSNDKKDKEGKP